LGSRVNTRRDSYKYVSEAQTAQQVFWSRILPELHSPRHPAEGPGNKSKYEYRYQLFNEVEGRTG
jgi:hypothetical protein